MLRLRFATSGTMTIKLEGLSITKHIRDPTANVKTYLASTTEITIIAKDMKTYSDFGVIELAVIQSAKVKVINVCIDSDVWAWYGSAQTIIDKDGQILLNDNFQSGVRGPVGNPKRYKSYSVEV